MTSEPPRHLARLARLLGAVVLVWLGATATAAATGERPPQVRVTVGGHPVTVEPALTPAQRERGLMERTSLAPDSGMLLVYPTPRRIALWMRNTPLALSAAFIDDDGTILNITRMEPLRLDIHLAAGAARYALEMEAGWFEAHGVKAGDRVEGLERLPAAE